MADALKPMSEAPKDGSALFATRDYSARLVQGLWRPATGRHHGDYLTMNGWNLQRPEGFLPLPADASSANVAKTAGEWLSVCSDEDVAAVIRKALRRPGVRASLQSSADVGTYGGCIIEAVFMAAAKAQPDD